MEKEIDRKHPNGEAEAKVEVLYCHEQQKGPMVRITVTYRPYQTLDAPDYWEVYWDHYLPILQEQLPSYLKAYTPPHFFQEIWEAVTELEHPDVGKLFPDQPNFETLPPLNP